MKENILIHKYIKNSKLDIEKIMLEYTPYIYKIVKSQIISLSNEDIEEITSDVFLAVWKNQDRLDVNKSMSTYLAGITKNLIKKKIRDIKPNSNIEDYEENLITFENIEITYEDNEKNEIIISELTNMNQEDRDVFLTYYYYSKKIKEISERFNISQSKVKSKLYRIRKRLKKSLEKRGYSYNG